MKNKSLFDEYITPLNDEPAHTNAGVIKAVGKFGEKYSVGKIEYQTFFNKEYQYIITPYWDVIDGLDFSIFQGIPGIPMEFRQETYYRVNVQPVFITERSPSQDREDLCDLMEAVGLDHYDRFEWLMRTSLHCGNDNLIVERYREDRREYEYEPGDGFVSKLQYGDRVNIKNQNAISKNPGVYTEKLLKLLGTGAQVSFQEEGLEIDMVTRSAIMVILRQQYYAVKSMKFGKHQQGVERAKDRGAYRGRKPIYIDEKQLRKVYQLFHSKKITESQAMDRLGIVSRSTFYRKIRKIKKRSD